MPEKTLQQFIQDIQDSPISFSEMIQRTFELKGLFEEIASSRHDREIPEEAFCIALTTLSLALVRLLELRAPIDNKFIAHHISEMLQYEVSKMYNRKPEDKPQSIQ